MYCPLSVHFSSIPFSVLSSTLRAQYLLYEGCFLCITVSCITHCVTPCRITHLSTLLCPIPGHILLAIKKDHFTFFGIRFLRYGVRKFLSRCKSKHRTCGTFYGDSKYCSLYFINNTLHSVYMQIVLAYPQPYP